MIQIGNFVFNLIVPLKTSNRNEKIYIWKRKVYIYEITKYIIYVKNMHLEIGKYRKFLVVQTLLLAMLELECYTYNTW